MQRIRILGAFLAAAVALLAMNATLVHAAASNAPDLFWVYVGTYTGAKSKGIYLYRFDSRSGEVRELGLAAETPNPTFLAVAPDRKYLYAANEIGQFQGKPAGAVSAYRLEPASGGLTLVNQASSSGSGPCHLVVDGTGSQVLVANYGGGSVAVLPVGADGRLAPASAFRQHTGSSVNPSRQQEPHAHCVVLDPSNHFAVAADLGIDQLVVYQFDAARGSLTPHQPPFFAVKPGAGPRHLAFHPDGRHAYCIHELNSTISALQWYPGPGTFRELETLSTLPDEFKGPNTTAEIVIHPSGRFLYGSNRGHDSIAIFSIEASSGRLKPLGHVKTQGRTPRNFAFDPTGGTLWAANQDSDTLVLFKVDLLTGGLQPTGKTLSVGAPVCVQFVETP